MVIRDFDFIRISVLPAKADPVLFVDADTILPGAIACKPLQAKTWERPIRQRRCRIEESQFEAGNLFDLLKFPAGNAPKQLLRLPVLARSDHAMRGILLLEYDVMRSISETKI